MGSSKTSTWVGGAVAAALVLILASYFLLISPVLASANDTSSQTETTRQQNELLQTKVAHLAEQFTHLDEYKAQLADLRTQVPTDAQLSAYLRRIDSLATSNKVTVTAVAAGDAQRFSPAVPASTGSGDATVDQTTANESGSTDGSTPTPSATKPAQPAAAAAVSAPDGMVDVPMTITAVGSYDHIDKFLNALQTTKGRLLLITTVTGTGQTDADAAGGRPKTEVGDLEVTVNGFLYVLPDSSSPAPTAAPTPTPLPAAVPGKNPMVPASS